FVPAGEQPQVARSLPHGHAAAVCAMARKLGFPALLGPPGPDRDLAYALILSRVLRPASKLSTAAWWDDVTLGADLGVAGAGTDGLYAAMDWLVSRQDGIEKELARRHLREGGIAMFDLSSSWVEGRHCELAARGYSRDGKRGRAQIEYGLLTDRAGRPVAVRVPAGNTGDPKTFPEAVDAVRGTFGLHQMIMAGDRGMITSARIAGLRKLDGMAWITCLRGPAIKKLMADDGPLQLTLSDEQDLAEIQSPDYPGERLIACRNPVLAAERARKRDDLLAATEAGLAAIAARVTAGRIKDPDKIGLAAGKIINKRKVAKHVTLDIAPGSCPGSATSPPSTPKQPPTGSTSSAPPSRRHPGRPRRSRRLQGPGQPRTRLPAHQSRRPGPAAHLAPPRGPCPRPRADLHARLLPDLAPAPGLGTADLHRRAPARPGQPRHPARRSASATPKPAARPAPVTSPSAASATSSTTWPP
ncbi:MAG: IS1634 family transposase, partial [Streptosporangiaceae bacterium]